MEASRSGRKQVFLGLEAGFFGRRIQSGKGSLGCAGRRRAR